MVFKFLTVNYLCILCFMRIHATIAICFTCYMILDPFIVLMIFSQFINESLVTAICTRYGIRITGIARYARTLYAR